MYWTIVRTLWFSWKVYPKVVNSRNHETEGLLSPAIRAARLKRAAALIPPDSFVLDLACGAGFLREYLPHCRYFGVDRIPPPLPQRFDGFLHGELTAPDFFEKLQNWLPQQADAITLLAFVEHVKEPEQILARLKPVLKERGKIILTTPHPMGRRLHDSLAKIYLCSRSGAAEHETFLGESELRKISQSAGFSVISYERFLFGLNQVVELVAH